MRGGWRRDADHGIKKRKIGEKEGGKELGEEEHSGGEEEEEQEKRVRVKEGNKMLEEDR